MAATSLYLSLSVLTFSLLHLPLASSISDATISTAADTLSTAGFTAMSLTLSLISKTLTISNVPFATIFAPSDDSFFLSLSSGQPPLSLLQLHFCPRFYSSSDLHSFSYGAQLPTFLPQKTLTITTTTTASSQISINGVNLTSDSPLFDDGSLAIFPIERFFNPNFTTVFTPSQSPTPTGLECPEPRSGSYGKLPAALRSKGYSAMAALLELQLLDFNGGQTSGMTVFAPNDDSMEGEFGNYTNWGRVFRRHVVPCELYFEDLVGFDDGSVLSTFLEGFMINVTQSDGALLLNGEITVDFPDFVRGDRVVVHGLSGILSVPEMLSKREAAADFLDHGEF